MVRWKVRNYKVNCFYGLIRKGNPNQDKSRTNVLIKHGVEVFVQETVKDLVNNKMLIQMIDRH